MWDQGWKSSGFDPELTALIDDQMDNLMLALHIHFVKYNDLKKTLNHAYQDLYELVYDFLQQKLNAVKLEQVMPRIKELLEGLISYWAK